MSCAWLDRDETPERVSIPYPLRGRTDLLILWPQGGRERRFAIECKVLHRDWRKLSLKV